MAAAARKPRGKPCTTPVAVVSVPAVVATAESTATPRAAPTSCPVIRKPEAMPACCGGMPAMAVTDTGTKTMPTPRPMVAMPGRMSVAKSAPLLACASRTAPPATRKRPSAAMPRGVPCARACLASTVPTVMARANGTNATPARMAEYPITVCTKMEVRNTVPTRMPVTPSMTAVPETSDLTFQVCGGTSGLVARRSMTRNPAASRADAASESSTRAESQPCCSVAPSAKMSATRLPMTVTAPTRSNWFSEARGVVTRGITLSPTTNAMAPMGALIQKMACQPAQVVRAPPSRTPAATPRDPTAPHRASPVRRCAPE